MTNKNKNSILFQPRSGSNCSSSLVFMLIIVLDTIINDKKHHYNISLEKHCNTTYCTLMIPITTTMLIIFMNDSFMNIIPATLRGRFVCVGSKSRRSHPPSSQAVATPIAAKGKASKRRLCETKFIPDICHFFVHSHIFRPENFTLKSV